ncbi:MAG: DNA polymerase III subunit delta [Peptococcaceae bacterium]
MGYTSLMNSIKRGVIAPVYLFYGAEKLLMEQSVRKLKDKVLPPELEAFNYDKVEGDKISLGQVIDLANTMPVMSEKRVVVVDNAFYFSAQKGTEGKVDEGALHNYLQNPNTGCCLIFKILGKADKRKKIFKAVGERGQTIEFAGLTGENLERWIQGFLQQYGKRADREACNYLSLLAGEGLDVLQNELEKLVSFSWDEPVIKADMVQEIVTRNTEINIFQLIDSIAAKQGKKALQLLQTSLAMGEVPLKLIYLLVRQFRMILIAKDLAEQGYSEKQIREKLQVQPFVAGKVLNQGRKFQLEQLVEALEKLLETEVLLKSSGGDPAEVMENLVIALCYK